MGGRKEIVTPGRWDKREREGGWVRAGDEEEEEEMKLKTSVGAQPTTHSQ